MKNITRFAAALSLPIALAGCEVISNVDITGQMQSFTQDQASVFVNSGTPLPASAMSVTGAVDLQVNSDCSGDDREITVSIAGRAWLKPGTGTLSVGGQSYPITHVSCDNAMQLSDMPGIESMGLFIAESNDTSEYAEVAIVLAKIGLDAPDTPSAQFAPLTGETVLLVFPHVDELLLPQVLSPFTIAAGIVELDPLPEDPTTTPGRQVIDLATQDLDALITADYSFTNWILRGASIALQRAAADRFWDTDNQLNHQKGRRAYSLVSIAISHIERIADRTDDVTLQTSLDAISNSLLDGMRALAVDQIAWATDNSGDEYKLDRAGFDLESGDIARGQDHLRFANRLYGGAWKKATRSVR